MTGLPRVGVVMLALAAAAPPLHSQQTVFRSGVDVVAVDVAVTRGRSPVTGLTAQDFQLLDNGVRQEIDAVWMGTVPIDVTLVLDLGGSTSAVWSLFREDVETMRAMLRPEDRLRLVSVSEGTREIRPMRPATEPVPPSRLAGGGLTTSLHDGIFLALARPSEPERRHLVVAFTDGFDTWSILDGDDLPALAERADAVLHAIVTASPPAAPPPDADGRSSMTLGSGGVTRMVMSRSQWERRIAAWNAGQRALFDAVARTGGSLHHHSNRVSAFAGVLATFRASYVLRYTPRGVSRPGWHELKVSVPKTGGLTIRARKGYEIARGVIRS